MDTNAKIYKAYAEGDSDTTRVGESDLYDIVCESKIGENGVITNPYEKMLIGDISNHKSPETLTEAYNKVCYIPDEMFLKED